MSGDVQPRKRKDKRKKKDASASERSKAEAEFIARQLSLADDSDEGPPVKTHHEKVHTAPSFAEGDSVIHVDHEGGTGGHWCAKIIFFALLAVLIGLIGLIIIENRGLTDLDTPVAESRYAQVFGGWVDEEPIHDDHHDEHTLELKHAEDEHDEEHDEDLGDDHDEEIEDIDSEGHDEASDDEHDEADSDIEHDDDDQTDNDDDDNQNASVEAGDDEADDDDDDDDDDDEDQADDDDDNVNTSQEDEENQADDDDDDDENQDNDDDDDDDDEQQDEDDDDQDSNELENENLSYEQMADGDDDEEEYLNISPRDGKNDESYENDGLSNEIENEQDNEDAPFDEIDSVEEEVIDNTAGEEELLAAKRAEKLAQEQQEDGVGMRVAVGVALVLVAYCVLARKWRNASENGEDTGELELNRRMTLIPDEVIEDEPEPDKDEEEEDEEEEEEEEEEEVVIEPKIEPKQPAPITQSLPQQSIFGKRTTPIFHKYVEEPDEEVVEPMAAKMFTAVQQAKRVEVTSKDIPDEDEEAEEDLDDNEDIEEITHEQVKNIQSDASKPQKFAHEEEELGDEEVEEEEELLDEEEELGEEEEIEEDISEEIDDSELMKKLEAKYGKLPEVDDEPEGQSDEEKPVAPIRKRAKPTGGNSIEEDDANDWNNDANNDWRQQLDLAQAEMDEGNLEEAYKRFTALTLTNPSCWRAKLGCAKTLDALAEARRNNNLLQNAITTYQEVLNLTKSESIFIEVAERVINRIRFRGKHLEAVPVHNMLIEKFPNEPKYRNHLTITYLMVNKPELARSVLIETLKLHPNDGVALVHYGFILKTIDNNLEEAIDFLQRGINTGEEGCLEGRFLFHLGDALARLGRNSEANKVYEYGAALKVFLSPLQRSLYNVDRLKGMPWWKPEQTPYKKFIRELEANWKMIAKEARDLRSQYKPEQENLKDTGDWSQYELFARGVEVKSHCMRCPLTCQIAKTESAAYGCRRGQIKFSAMSPGTHVFAHTGPTNCRLRAHLGLQGTNNTFIRVGNEIRSWEEGKVFIFDDSFEHEVWHNGTDLRIVLIVDLWHPELTKEERISLPAI